MQAECERLRQERDAFAKQFEELADLRNSGAEALLTKFKEAAETKARGELSGCPRANIQHKPSSSVARRCSTRSRAPR